MMTTWKNQTRLFPPFRVAEKAKRLKNWLTSSRSDFSALDPCRWRWSGIPLTCFMAQPLIAMAIEIDANQGRTSESDSESRLLQANTMDVEMPRRRPCLLLYLNPPYDWESGESNNQRLELVFLERFPTAYRWLNSAAGVLLFRDSAAAIVAKCARLLIEHFTDFAGVPTDRAGSCLQYQQIVVLAIRRKRHSRVTDAALLDGVRYLRSAGNEERA